MDKHQDGAIPHADDMVGADAVVGVYLTFPDAETAAAVASALVEGGHAACVNVLPAATSVYRWHGEVKVEPEVVAWAKSTRSRLAGLTAAVLERHPHEVPCVVAYAAAGGLPAYLDWVRES